MDCWKKILWEKRKLHTCCCMSDLCIQYNVMVYWPKSHQLTQRIREWKSGILSIASTLGYHFLLKTGSGGSRSMTFINWSQRLKSVWNISLLAVQACKKSQYDLQTVHPLMACCSFRHLPKMMWHTGTHPLVNGQERRESSARWRQSSENTFFHHERWFLVATLHPVTPSIYY